MNRLSVGVMMMAAMTAINGKAVKDGCFVDGSNYAPGTCSRSCRNFRPYYLYRTTCTALLVPHYLYRTTRTAHMSLTNARASWSDPSFLRDILNLSFSNNHQANYFVRFI